MYAQANCTRELVGNAPEIPSALGSLMTQLRGLADNISGHRARLENIADVTFGVQPQPPKASGGDTMPSAGVLDEISNLISVIRHEVNLTGDQVQRLSKLVN